MSNDLQCADMGLGVPVVLIHGYPLDHKIWENQFVLSKDCRILAPDLPGFGTTPSIAGLSIADYADLILKLLDEKHIDEAVVIGHSMGGYIALEFAARHKKRLLGLGLIHTQAEADSEEARANRIRTIDRVNTEGTGFVIQAMAEKLLARKNVSNLNLVHQLKAIMQNAAQAGIVTALKAMADRYDHLDNLANVAVLTLIVAGEEDALIPMEKSELMRKKIKNGAFEKISGAGHLSMMENPEEFNRVMIKFLKSIKN